MMDSRSDHGAARPANELQRSALSIEACQALVDACDDGLCLVDLRLQCIIFANATLTTWHSNSSCGDDLFAWLTANWSEGVHEQLAQLASGTMAAAVFSSRLRIAGDVEAEVECRARRVERDGRALLAIFVRRAAATAAADARRQVDPLTGLADRSCLMERLAALVEGQRSKDRQCAVLFIDVDGFKQVNDAFGHLVGDRVLCEVARRLAACVRAEDCLARFGGDEFVVLLQGVSGKDEIQPVVERITAAFARPVGLPQGSVTLTVSVGVAEAGGQPMSATELLDMADRAMYAAKRTTP